MNRKEESRNYKMSDANLVQLSDSIHNTANRDITELGDYGVDAGTLTTLMAARDVFSDNPTDEELSADMVIATQNKNAERENLRISIRQIADRARIKYGEQDGKFRKFGVDLLSKQSDNDLVRTGRRVVRAATEYEADLATEGLTPIMITDLSTLTDTFDDLIDLQDAAIKERDVAVDVRIRLGNDLYALLTNLAAKGKLCWQDNNEAKYNDYVITSSSGGSTAEVVSGSVASNEVVNASVTGITDTTTLRLENTGDAMLEFFFASSPTDDNGPMMISVPPHTSESHSAVALGYSEADGRDRFNVFNSDGMPGSYLISWE